MLQPTINHGRAVKTVFPYKINYSALFADSTEYLTRTPASAGNGRTFMYRQCIKRAFPVSADRSLFSAGASAADTFRIELGFTGTTHKLFIYNSTASTGTIVLNGPIVADETGHYDIQVAVDTTQVVETDRVKVWINGKRVVLTGTYPTQNLDTVVNKTVPHAIAQRRYDLLAPGSGYYSDVYLTDGTTYEQSTFGELSDVVTGVRIPKSTGTITYGTNGCHLDFSDVINLGKDVSGEGNNWVVNGTPSQTLDTMTANHATFNSLYPHTGVFTNGNTTITPAANNADSWASTLVIDSGKHWCRFTINGTGGTPAVGLIQTSKFNPLDYSGLGTGTTSYFNSPLIYVNGTNTGATPSAWSDGVTIDVCVDMDATTVEYFNNGISQGSFDISSIASEPLLFFYSLLANTATPASATIDVGATGTTPVDGFAALTDASLSDPTIMKSSTAADLVTRVGTGAATSVTGLDFAPDWVNMKGRNLVVSWGLFDTERGANHVLSTNNTAADYAGNTQILTALNSDGYDLGTDITGNGLNNNYLDLCLKAGIDQGFTIKSLPSYVAGTSFTNPLGKPVTFALLKSTSFTTNWWVFHKDLTNDYQLVLNSTDAKNSVGGTGWFAQNTATTLELGSWINGFAGEDFILYLFTDSDIFKAFSGTGNGIADGPFVNLGGRPLSIPFFKDADSTGGWVNHDAVRNPVNTVKNALYPHQSASEVPTYDFVNFTAQGFKIVNSVAGYNTNGNLHVGLAILESKKYSNAF